MIVRNSSTLSTGSSSVASSYTSSLKPPSVLTDDWDADDEDTMSTGDHASTTTTTKPLSVAIPNASPYCPRRPNLREILANTSPAPWTLAAFMAYLSNNHCLETLEFTMDAGRYKKHYYKMMAKAPSDGVPPAKDRQYVQDLWGRLVEAYIKPDGTREVNLPSDVRDSILKVPEASLPPAPEKLDTAVAKIYELMEDSVLVPFLNSAYPQASHPTMPSAPSVYSDDGSSSTVSRTTTHSSRNSKPVRNSEPPSSATHSYSAPAATFRRSAPSPLMNVTGKSRFSSRLTPSTSSPAAPLSRSSVAERSIAESEASHHYSSGIDRMPPMMDDSGSTNSPTGDSPSTPPMSPPMGDASPKRDSGMWKKLGRLSSGMKAGKKKSHAGLRNQEE